MLNYLVLNNGSEIFERKINGLCLYFKKVNMEEHNCSIK